MGEKLIVGPINNGLRTDREPFNIDNDSFPTLINAYQWRGRIKRKRGTSLLCRLQRWFDSTSVSYNPSAAVMAFNGSGVADILTAFTLEFNGCIVPGTVTIVTAGNTYTDPTKDGYLTPTGTNGPNTINYANGTVTIPAEAGNNAISVKFVYNPFLPVLGLEDLQLNPNIEPGTMAFDQTYSYVINTTSPYNSYDVSFYKNPAADAINLPGYVPKTNWTPVWWNSQDYQQYWTVNYQGALWATNGVTAPFNTANIGLPFAASGNITYISNTVDTITVRISGSPPLVVGDYVFFNEWVVTDAKTSQSLNGLTGYVTNVIVNNPVPGTNQYVIKFPFANIRVNAINDTYPITAITSGNPTVISTKANLAVGSTCKIKDVQGMTQLNGGPYNVVASSATTISVAFDSSAPPPYTGGGTVYEIVAPNTVTPGIIIYLTNRSDNTKDCIRFYDGDPVNGVVTNPTFIQGKGWVNYCPPLSKAFFSISDLPLAQYYLVGARMMIPFKDRLLFIGPVVSTSSGVVTYLQDTVIYSQNGTPYYTCTFNNDPSLSTTNFNTLLCPANQTATANAMWEDQAGFGGFIQAGVSQPITTVSPNEDALIMGFKNLSTRFVYSGNDLIPFNFFLVNSEMGSSSTFSAINFDQGVMTRGDRGFIITSQTESQRIDLPILNKNFEISLVNNGTERITAQRDFLNEWAYFTYPSDSVTWRYPNQTLQYNYRDNSWATFNECYTTYGQFRARTGYTWSTIGTRYPTWSSWNATWNSGASQLLQPKVIAGNQQGFVIERDDSTFEATSLYIQNISGNTITSADHCLNVGDYILISGVLGNVLNNNVNPSVSINNTICQVVTVQPNFFTIDVNTTGTYLGGGLIKRMYIPFIQTKQFPTSWGMGRKTRIGVQQYLLSTTQNGQITLQIYLSQNAAAAANTGPIVPQIEPLNSGLIYSTVLYTCPESTNLGLTPFTSNLQMPGAISQAQIWHRVNTSLIGDTVQLAFTLSDAQMRDTTFSNQFTEIELHGFIMDLNPSQLLA